jgi:hypothetical protein
MECWKHKHPTKQQALDHRRALLMSHKTPKKRRHKLIVYRCEHCQSWHVGHGHTRVENTPPSRRDEDLSEESTSNPRGG